MDGTVVVENNTKVQELYDSIFKIDTKRKHFSINNKYAVGVVRKYREIFIFDYERSGRPLVKVKNGGQTVLLRLGFLIPDLLEVLESLQRIMFAVVAPKAELPTQTPQLLQPIIPASDPRSTIGLNQDGKIVMQNTTEFKKRLH